MSKDPNYAAKRAHAKDAYVSGCWIFWLENDTWYSPEEFMASNESASFYRGKEDLNKFKIIHPSVGLAKKRDLIKLLEKEVNEMERRIIKYEGLKFLYYCSGLELEPDILNNFHLEYIPPIAPIEASVISKSASSIASFPILIMHFISLN